MKQYSLTWVITVALSLLLAQVTVWGLAQFGVHSGLLGPYLLICVASTVVSIGSRSSD